jgi:enamine deaminase RidA (YjgF/YER057c/UK114 family)
MIAAFLAAAAATTQAAPATSEKGARQQARIVMPDDARQLQLQEQIGWSEAVVAGDTVYVSGVIAALRESETDQEAAFVRAFDRLGTILKRAGVTWDDVVEVRTYHTNPGAQIRTFSEVKKRYIKPPHPAWTAVGTSGLLQPRGLVEIALVAKVPSKGGKGR